MGLIGARFRVVGSGQFLLCSRIFSSRSEKDGRDEVGVDCVASEARACVSSFRRRPASSATCFRTSAGFGKLWYGCMAIDRLIASVRRSAGISPSDVR